MSGTGGELGGRSSRARRAALAVLPVLLMLAACDSDGTDSPVSPTDLPSLTIQDLVSSVEALGVQAAVRGGTAPAPGNGPRITVSGNSTVVNGGTLSAAVAGAAPFQTLYLYVASETTGLATAAPGGIDGYYELRLPSPRSDAALLLGIAQNIPLRDLDLMFAVADPAGAIGPYARLSTTVTTVGTGDVQVTLSWDSDSDVDLHVIDPAGEEIYYAHTRAASGGELDLDSNAGCSIDGVRNENITWPVGAAPRGTYTVRVDYWSSCGVPSTSYSVRVNAGGNVQIFTGSFTGPGDQGGAGSGRNITTFERLTGPTAAPPPPGSGVSTSGAGVKTRVVPQR
ncbi:MAG TPA: hypothetical protein VHJ69_02410 [Gemmatimonadales bacterium]|jgi:hypothetical protein|nr:hypothetical protein [Gemmatimonadales bacterium]